MTYITVTDVRTACGAPTSLVTDSQIEYAITMVEAKTSKWLNTAFTPTRRIDILDGNGLPYFFITKKPLLSVRSLKSNDTEVILANLDIYKMPGKISLSGDSDMGQFVVKARSIICEYYYGWLEHSTITTDTDTASTAGSSVALSVDDETGFSTNDWVEIIGTDGHQEHAKITGTATGEITVDKLIFSHVSGSIVTKLQIPVSVKRFMELEAGVYIALNAMGSTYTFNTHYSLGDLEVTKGVPYPHFTTQFEKMTKERAELLKIVRPRLSIGI